ncbi:MAG: MATE family efflux transporter [Eubacteriales bacterium]|nr:MATE family efflux transporter [Eubacteriales bacterium]
MQKGANDNTQKENKMGVRPIGKLLVSMSLPMMISMFIQGCYNIVDSIYVSQISEAALTAVSLAFPIQMLMISVAVGTSVGMNSLISRRLGEKRFDAANAGATNGLFLLAISAIVFTIFGFTLAKPFFALFTEDPVIYRMGGEYLSICAIFCFGIFMQCGCERIIQATGNTIYPMLMQLTGAVINIIMDPILIFGRYGFPQMGIRGAAVATVLGQLIAMCLSFYLLFFKKHEVKVSFKHFRPHKETIRQIYTVGLPSIIMQSIGSVTNVCMNWILIAFTPTAVSVLGVYFKLNSFAFMPVFALSSGAMSIMGYNFGARNRKRLMDTLKYVMLFALSIMAVGVLLFQLIPDQMLLLFNASPEMLTIGVPALRIISISFFGAAICISFSTVFQAVGNGIYSLFMSLLRQLLCLLPVAFLFSKLWGLSAVWWSFPIAELMSLGACLIMFRKLNKAKIRPLDKPVTE